MGREILALGKKAEWLRLSQQPGIGARREKRWNIKGNRTERQFSLSQRVRD
jgi:hypothetical protein